MTCLQMRYSSHRLSALLGFLQITRMTAVGRLVLPYLERAIQLTPNAPQTGVYYGILGEAFIHQGNFIAAGPALTSANHSLDRTNLLFLRYQAGCELMLGSADQARATLAEAQALNPDRSLSTEAKTMAFYSTDRGGVHFLTLWRELGALTAGH